MQSGFHLNFAVVARLGACDETNYTVSVGVWPKAHAIASMWFTVSQVHDGTLNKSRTWMCTIPRISDLWRWFWYGEN